MNKAGKVQSNSIGNRLKGLVKWPIGRLLGLSVIRYLFSILTLYRLPVWVQLVGSAVLTALTVLVLEGLNIKLEGSIQVLVTIVLFVVILVILHVISSLVLYARLGEQLQSLISLQRLVKQPARGALAAFITRNLSILQGKLAGVLSQEGLEMDKLETDFWTQICFEAGDAPYDGTDRHIPSQFLRRYENYLRFHEVNIERTKTSGDRVLLVTKQDLYDDYAKNGTRSQFNHLWEWHDRVRHEEKVGLLYIDHSRALELAKDLPTTDIGIWRGKFALLFTPISEHKTVFRMVLKGDPTYDKCVEYFKMLRREALPVKHPPTLVEEELAEYWEDFVNPQARLSEEAKFLERVFAASPSIQTVFDAATGIGVESVFLCQKDYHVVSNEVDEHLRAGAQTYSSRQVPPVQLSFTQYDWRQLQTYQIAKYDVVLVLGNSLCLVSDADERLRSVRGFAHILKKGGILVIDERNFPRILRKKNSILANPFRNFPFKGTIMYCGTAIKGCPIRINGNKVTFAYYSTRSSVDGWENLKTAGVIKGTLDMYPFTEGELCGLLKSCGFVNVTPFSDFEEGYNHDADFFTYVAIKA